MAMDWPAAAVILTALVGAIIAVLKLVPTRNGNGNKADDLANVKAELHYVKVTLDDFKDEVRSQHKEIRSELKSITERFKG